MHKISYTTTLNNSCLCYVKSAWSNWRHAGRIDFLSCCNVITFVHCSNQTRQPSRQLQV